MENGKTKRHGGSWVSHVAIDENENWCRYTEVINLRFPHTVWNSFVGTGIRQ